MTSTGELVELGIRVTGACLGAIGSATDWSLTEARRGQHVGDLDADRAGVALLAGAGLSVFSEESGFAGPAGGVVAVIDPIDGSTNASRGIPYWSSSVCFLDGEGPLAAVVRSAPLGDVYTAIRGGGAYRNGTRVATSGLNVLSRGIIYVNGNSGGRKPWAQMRSLGSAALELALMACGSGDGFVDFSDGLAVWDYAGGALILEEAGGSVANFDGSGVTWELVSDRHRLVAGATRELVTGLIEVLANPL